MKRLVTEPPCKRALQSGRRIIAIRFGQNPGAIRPAKILKKAFRFEFRRLDSTRQQSPAQFQISHNATPLSDFLYFIIFFRKNKELLRFFSEKDLLFLRKYGIIHPRMIPQSGFKRRVEE